MVMEKKKKQVKNECTEANPCKVNEQNVNNVTAVASAPVMARPAEEVSAQPVRTTADASESKQIADVHEGTQLLTQTNGNAVADTT